MAYAALRAEIASIRGDAAAYLLALSEAALEALADLAEAAADDAESEGARAESLRARAEIERIEGRSRPVVRRVVRR